MGLGSIGLDPTPITGTDPNEATIRINLHTHTGNPGEGDQIDSANIIVIPSGDITADNQADANVELNIIANLGRKHVEKRQTVLKGLTSNGSPVFLAAVAGQLAINALGATKHIVIAFAAGYDDDYGAIDYIGKIIADISGAWSGLTPNTTCYLYIDRNPTTGALTCGFSTLAPIYQKGGTASATNGQHTFDIDDMIMYVGNGSIVTAVQRVFIGEAVTGASAVTGTPITYALKGQALLQQATLANGTKYTLGHNIGVKDLLITGYLECKTAQNNFAVGDRLYFYGDGCAGLNNNFYATLFATDYKSLYITIGPNGPGIGNKNTGANDSLTVSNWLAGAIVKRAF